MNAEQAIQRLMEQIKREAESANLSKVTEVRLRLGCWENMDEKDLTAAFYRLKGDGLLATPDWWWTGKTAGKVQVLRSLFECFILKPLQALRSNYMEFIVERGIVLEGIDGIE